MRYWAPGASPSDQQQKSPISATVSVVAAMVDSNRISNSRSGGFGSPKLPFHACIAATLRAPASSIVDISLPKDTRSHASRCTRVCLSTAKIAPSKTMYDAVSSASKANCGPSTALRPRSVASFAAASQARAFVAKACLLHQINSRTGGQQTFEHVVNPSHFKIVQKDSSDN